MKEKLTPEQMRALIEYASKKLGVTPEQLSQTVEGDMAHQLASKVSKEDAAKFQALVGDKDKLETMLKSPRAQQLIEKLLGASSER